MDSKNHIIPSAVIKPSFKERMDMRRMEAENAAIPMPLPKPVAEDRDNVDDADMLKDILDNCEITEWEQNFCESCIKQLKRVCSLGLSVKQAAVLDKLAKEYLPENKTGDPTPKGNPPAQYATRAMRNEMPFPIGFKKADYDEDGDIPF